MESGHRHLAENPRKSASWISTLLFGWSIPIFKKSYNNNLHPNDAIEPLDDDRSKTLGDRLERCAHFLLISSHAITKNEFCD